MTDLSILGSKGESKQHTPVESPDSLINISYANILDGISEGPIVGLVSGAQSIYLDKTPLANSDGSLNFTGVTWEQRTGEHDQDHIAGFPAVESQVSVGVELKASQPWVQAFSNLELSAVRIQLATGALVVTEQDGDRVGYKVAYEIDLSTDDSDYQVVQQGALDGKNTTGYQRSIRIDLPKAERGWRLRVRRTTPDSTTSNIQANTSIGTYTEIIDAKLQYPYTALCGLKIDASQFSAVPERAYRIRGRIIQVPSNYDPAGRTYSGTWDGTFKLAWTDCPAWIWRDIVLNDRYGLGRFIDASQVDKWALYQIAQYCDQLVSDGKGGQEPRFTCNVYLQSRADALTVLQDLASVFRGMSYYAGSQVACAADMPGDPVYTYTNANVIDGKFNRAGSSGSTRFSVAKVAWSDRENFGNQRVEYVQDQRSLARYGVRETEITAFGCVSQGQAQRAGQYILLTNRLETGTISFSVGLDGTICRPGDIIRVADEHYAGVPLAGRIKAATASSVTLDNDITAAAGDTLVVILPKGVAETRVIRSIAGREVTVTEPFSAVPVKESVYTIETAELVAETYRVLSVNENFGDDKLQYDIVAVARNDSKFDAIDNGAQIVIPPTSVLPAAVQAPPSNVQLSTFDTLNQGINIATMRITWDAPRGAQSYRVWWRRNNGDWIYAGVTYTAALEVRGIYTGTYTARVAAVGVAGNSSVWALSEPTMLYGKTGEPPAITSLTTESLLFGIGLKWTFPQGAEDTQRTELWYSEGTDLAAATKLADLAYPQSEHVMQGLRGGQRFFFWARLVDRSGNIGPWFPADGTLVSGMASMDAGPILEQIKDQITESELGKELTSKIELIEGNGPGSVNERVGTAKTELAKQISEVNNALADTKSNLQQQITSVGQSVTDAKAELQQQITAVSTLAGSLPYRKDKTYSIGQSALGSDGKLYQALKAVPLNTPPPNATYWTDVGQAVVTANGIAARVSKVETDVSTLDGKTTAQASQIQSLQTSLTATDKNVAKKADATVVDSLTLRVSDAEGKLTSEGKRIDGLQTSLDGKASSTALQQVTARVTATEQKDAAQDQQLTSQSQALTSLTDSVSKKAEAATVQALSNEVKTQGQNQTAQGQALTNLNAKLLASQDNSPTKVYQSVFSGMALDQWSNLFGGATATTAFSNVEGNTSGATLTVGGGSGDATWWGSSSRKIRFDPTRLYKLSIRFKQLTAGKGNPVTYAGVDGFAEDGVTRINTSGANSKDSSHYVLTSGRSHPIGEWVEFTSYVKGYTVGDEGGGTGAGTVADPKRLKTGVAWISPMLVAGYQNIGGTLAVDYFTIEDATEQAQIDAGATATNALTVRVEKTEQGLSSVSNQATQLGNSLTTTNQNVANAQKAAQEASTLAGSKGKTLVQRETPAAADQLPQNIWIDITNGANTPKRWTTAGWIPVTDKVATDAAAAAASALAEVAKKADASALQSLNSKVDQQGKDLTAASSSLVSLGSTIGRALDNSPTKVYQSVFSDMALDQWVSTNSGATASASFGAPLGITRGTALVLDGGSGNATWWGASTRKIRFDPTRLYKLTVRVQQVAMGAGAPGTYAGVDCYAEDGKTRVSTLGTNSVGSSHYVVLSNRKIPQGEWVTAEVYVKGHTTGDEGGGAGAGTVANPRRLKEGTAWFSPMVIAGYDNMGGRVVFDYFDIEDATEQAQLDANAAATSALTTRVGQTEQGLTSASNQLTELNNSIGDVGGENLVYNPSFEKVDPGTPGMADGWWYDGTGGGRVPSLVPSTIASGLAQRLELTELTPSTWARVYVKSNRRFKVAPGKTYTASVFMRGTAGLRILPQVYGIDAAGASTSSWPGTRVDAGDNWARLSVTFTPDSKTSVIYPAFVVYGGASVSGGYIEADQYQVEEGARATGWRDNGQIVASQQSATSAAVDSLNSTVSQQGSALSSVSGRTTSLENAVNSTSSGLATKASAEAVNSLGNRVKQTEEGLSSASSSVVDLRNSIAAVKKAVDGAIGMDPAPGCLWQFDSDAEGWYGANATITNGKGYIRVTATTGNPQLQSSSASLNLAGALYTRIRVQITRRAGADWNGKLYYSTASHSFSSSYWAQAANPNIAVGQSAIVEWDMANLSGGGSDWVDSTIQRIRMDLGAATGGSFDVDWIAVGRVAPGASSRALSSLESTVDQQGSKLTAETKRIDGLYASVDSANAAVQSEAKTRADADSAIGKRVDTVQSNLGSTNASVQQISAAQANLNGKVNATWSVKLGLTSGGNYYAAGFGLGLENQGGTFQSSFVVLANQFAVMNPVGEGLVSVFAAENGQVVIADALISKLSVQKAMVGSTIASAALTNWGPPVLAIDFQSGLFRVHHPTKSGHYVSIDRNGVTLTAGGVNLVEMSFD